MLPSVERKYRYLQYADRLIIERMYNSGHKVAQIAVMISVSSRTVYREIRRGLYDRLDGQTWLYCKAYSADIAQADADYQSTAKGRPLKIGNDHALAHYIEQEILSGKSPDVVIHQLARQGKRPFSTVTLYRYIDQGVFLNLSNADLPEKPRRKRSYHKVQKAAKAPRGTSIEHRPSPIDCRELFGHWEMDLVIGRAVGKHQALLTLTERKTRYEMVFPLPNKSTRSVVRALDSAFSMPNASSVFQSITVDNGSEFSDCNGMEYDRHGQRRTTVYYCHPYSSYERGTNERMNRMLRRFFPKGKSMSKVTKADCQAAADWLNNYPRKILGYATPAELFRAELAALGIPFP